MFRRVAGNGDVVRFVFDGQEMIAASHDTVAQALFLNGVKACRDTVVNGKARGPYCMMGVCFDCLVKIDGVQNQRACQIRVMDAMQVERQDGGRTLVEGVRQ